MDDLISRQAAVDYFVTNVGWIDEDGYRVEDADEIRQTWTDIFNGIQPAEQRTGRWESFAYRKYVCEGRIYRCSECNKLTYGKHKYCPECGAKMEVEHE